MSNCKFKCNCCDSCPTTCASQKESCKCCKTCDEVKKSEHCGCDQHEHKHNKCTNSCHLK